MFLNKLRNSNKPVTFYLNDLKPESNILFIFDHGLGDYVMFLNIFELLIKTYPQHNFYLAYNEMFGDLNCLHKNMHKISLNGSFDFQGIYFRNSVTTKYNIPELEKEFDIVAEIIFHEPPSNQNKMDMCCKQEIGLPKTPNAGYYKLYNDPTPVKKTNIIGMHFVSNSGINSKSLNINEIKVVYNTVLKMGYTPLIFFPKFKASNPEYFKYKFDWIPTEHLFTSEKLSEIIQKISECKYFFGVSSGPICIAQNILGDDRCASMLKFDKTLDHFIYGCNMIQTRKYDETTIKNIIAYLNNTKSDLKEEKIKELEQIEYQIKEQIEEKTSKKLYNKNPLLNGLTLEEKIAKVNEINRRNGAL